jgi:hypothetical protein
MVLRPLPASDGGGRCFWPPAALNEDHALPVAMIFTTSGGASVGSTRARHFSYFMAMLPLDCRTVRSAAAGSSLVLKD